MFTNYTWKQILKHIKYLPSNSSGAQIIITHPNSNMYYISVKHEMIYVSTRDNPKDLTEIPQRIFEAIYNELQHRKRLPNKKSPNISNISNAEVVLAILGQLPETQYDKMNGTLLYKR